MTQQQHGPVREEVDDLRNIVDRLDVLMGSAPSPSPSVSRTPSTAELIASLGERVDELEGDLAEVRTLVNHLMTIATWQAKVTATLVDDRAGEDADAPTAADPSLQDGTAGARHDDEVADHRRADSADDGGRYDRSGFADSSVNGLSATADERPADSGDPHSDQVDGADDQSADDDGSGRGDDRAARWQGGRAERMPAGGWRREREDDYGSYGWDDRRRPPPARPRYGRTDHDADDLTADPPRREGAPPDFGI